MPRPRKPKQDLYSSEIRVKVPPSLKALIQQAASKKFLDEPSFVRALLQEKVQNREPIGV